MIASFFEWLEDFFKDETKDNVILAIMLNNVYNGIQGV